MRKSWQLLEDIQETLRIQTTRADFMLYSLLGRMALASVWDKNTSKNMSSVTYIKRRIETLLRIYLDIYPDIVSDDDAAILTENLADTIFNIYDRTGYFYEKPQLRAPACSKNIQWGNIILQRSAFPRDDAYMSGLASFTENNLPSAEPLFSSMGVEGVSDIEITEKLIAAYPLTYSYSLEDFSNYEFLNMQRKIRQRYWSYKPVENQVSLLLNKDLKEKRMFRFYSYDGKELRASAYLPEWIEDNRFYFRIQRGLLLKQENSLPFLFYFSPDGVVVRSSYCLPGDVQMLFELVSWPLIWKEYENPFARRVMDKRVFVNFRESMESIGYEFMEDIDVSR